MKTVKQLQLLSLAVMLLAVSACQSKPKDGLTDTYTSGVIAIAADESFQPIVQEEVDVFEGLFPLAGIEVNSFNSRKFFPQEIKIATDGLALITNRENPDTLITVNEIRSILTGKVTQWKEIYPASRLKDIRLVFDNKNSSTVRFAVDSICKGAPLSDQVKALKTNREVIDFVSKTPDAIGIIGVNWLSDRNDSTGLSFSKEVRVMSVSAADKATPENSFKPYQAYLFYGDYPLARSIYALLNDPRSALPWGFASFLASDRGQRIILKSGLVPATQPVRVVNIKDK